MDNEREDELFPHNEAAEEAVVGTALISPEVLDDTDLTPSDFFYRRHAIVWDTLLGMRSRGAFIDDVTLGQALQAREDWREYGDESLLIELMAKAGASLKIPHYAAILKQCSARRAIRARASEVVRDSEANQTAEELVRNASAAWATFSSDGKRSGFEEATWPVGLFLSQVFPTDFWMLDNVLARSGLNFISGSVGSGKSWLAIDSAIAAATGGHGLLGKRFEPGVRTLYFGADNSLRTVQRRLDCLTKGREISIDQAHELPLHIIDEDFDLATSTGLGIFQRHIERNEAQLVVVDVLAAYADVDLSDQKDARKLMRGLRRVANRTGATMVLVTHQTKADAARGKSGGTLEGVAGSLHLAGGVDTALTLMCDGDYCSCRWLRQVKNRDGIHQAPVILHIDPTREGGITLRYEDRSGQKTTSDALDIMLEAVREAGDTGIKSGGLADALKDGKAWPGRYDRFLVLKDDLLDTGQVEKVAGDHPNSEVFRWKD